MKTLLQATLLLFMVNCGNAQQTKKAFVDFNDLENLMTEVKPHREKRLIDLNEFSKKSLEKNTVILDTRSKEMYYKKHVKGAININFSDFTQDVLDDFFQQYAGKNTQILIYCNNNFEDKLAGNLQDVYFISKVVKPDFPIKEKVQHEKPKTLALNIPTYLNLYGYGYKNVFELNELVDVNDERIAFEGTDSKPKIAYGIK